MWSDDEVGRFPERVALGQRLRVGDVETRTGNQPGLESNHEISGVHRSAAADVDKKRGRFHGFEERSVKLTLCLRCEGEAVGDHVGLAEIVNEIFAEPDPGDKRRTAAAAVADGRHPHPGCIGQSRHLGADAAQTDHEHRLAAQTRERRRVADLRSLPFSNLLSRDRPVEASSEGAGQRHHVLAYHRRRHALAIGQEHLATSELGNHQISLDPGGAHLNPAKLLPGRQ